MRNVVVFVTTRATLSIFRVAFIKALSWCWKLDNDVSLFSKYPFLSISCVQVSPLSRAPQLIFYWRGNLASGTYQTIPLPSLIADAKNFPCVDFEHLDWTEPAPTIFSKTQKSQLTWNITHRVWLLNIPGELRWKPAVTWLLSKLGSAFSP